MIKKDLVEKLKELQLSQKDFCEQMGYTGRALNPYNNEDEVPKLYANAIKIQQELKKLREENKLLFEKLKKINEITIK